MFALSSRQIDEQTLRDRLEEPRAGGVVCFVGVVRNHNDGRAVLQLEYEAYEQLANTEGLRVLAEAQERYDILNACCVHRVGVLAVGDTAVWVGVSAAHRGDAFQACRFIIDQIKHRLPIWKKEHYADGESGWVNGDEFSEAKTRA